MLVTHIRSLRLLVASPTGVYTQRIYIAEIAYLTRDHHISSTIHTIIHIMNQRKRPQKQKSEDKTNRPAKESKNDQDDENSNTPSATPGMSDLTNEQLLGQSTPYLLIPFLTFNSDGLMANLFHIQSMQKNLHVTKSVQHTLPTIRRSFPISLINSNAV